MDLLLKLIFIFISWNIYIFYYRYIRMKIEKLEELNGEFIFTHLLYIRSEEMYFNIKEVRSVSFSKMVMKNNEFSSLTLVLLLEDGNIIRICNKRNSIVFFKSCKENTPELYEEIFLKGDIFGGVPNFLGLSSVRDIVENEIKNLED